jgi:hypothetical protein
MHEFLVSVICLLYIWDEPLPFFSFLFFLVACLCSAHRTCHLYICMYILQAENEEEDNSLFFHKEVC